VSVPIVGNDGRNGELLQLLDKYEGEFTAEDEQQFLGFAQLVTTVLVALWNVWNLEKDINI
jgi:hypothetical protein